MNHYGLDPAWYFSAPGLAWDATLKITNGQLELLNNPDMLLMIESGIATISHCHAKANNEYMGTDFDPAEVQFFKLMNNSVFGKTLEPIRNRIDIPLITTDKVAQKLAAKPNYDCCTIFDENLVAVYMKKTKLYFNKPVYLAMSILDLSKPFDV